MGKFQLIPQNPPQRARSDHPTPYTPHPTPHTPHPTPYPHEKLFQQTLNIGESP
ncbi:MAG: hypothetical protein O9295_25970 [Microcystis sp. LE18-22.4A]|nr:hypothetical protein [Microcystis sp. LE18-22.4A]